MELLAVVFALVATMCWGMDQVLGKFSLRSMDVLTLNTFRPGFALVFIIPYALLIGQPAFGSWELIALAALAGLVADFVGAEAYFYLINRSRANLVIPVGNSDPLWASLLSIMFLGEEASALVLVSIVLVVLGSFVLGLESRGDSKNNWLGGVVMVAIVALVWGATIPVTKYCLNQGMATSSYQMVRIGAAFLGCFALWLARRSTTRLVNPARTLRIVFTSGFLAYFIGYTLWLLALNMEAASVISPFLGWKAVFGVVFCGLILKEKTTKRAVLGMLAIALGVVLVSI